MPGVLLRVCLRHGVRHTSKAPGGTVPSGLRSRLMDRFGAWLAAIATEALGRYGLHGPLMRLHGESDAGKCVKGAKARAALAKPSTCGTVLDCA